MGDNQQAGYCFLPKYNFMNLLDWIIIAIICFFLIRSILRGASREIFSILALFLGGIISYRYYPVVKALIQPHLNKFLVDNWIQNFLVFVVSFCVVYLVVAMTGRLLSWILKKIHLGFLDRAMGALIGIAKACVFASCLIMLLPMFPGGGNLVKHSRLSHYGLPAITLMLNLLPPPISVPLKQKIVILKRK